MTKIRKSCSADNRSAKQKRRKPEPPLTATIWRIFHFYRAGIGSPEVAGFLTLAHVLMGASHATAHDVQADD